MSEAKKYSKKRSENYNDTTWSSNSLIFCSFPTNKEGDNIEQLEVELSEKSLIELCEKFFDNEFYLFLALLINLSILYARQNNRHRFTCFLSEMKSFLGVLMFSGYHELPQKEMHWSLDPACSTSVVHDALTRQRYKEIKRNLHLSNNANLSIDDKLLKVKPFMNLLKKYICSLVYSNLICQLMSN